MVKRTAKAVAIRHEPVAVMDNTDKVIDAIVKAAANPAFDADKMRQLVAMQADMRAQAAKIAYDNALAEMQPHLPIINRKGRIEIREKDAKGDRTGKVVQSTAYAYWEDISEAITPILHKYGFSLSFRTPTDPSGRISVTAVLARGGHREETTLSYQHDTTGSKNAAQAINSSVSYGMRKTACMLLNITTRGEDDDAKKSEALEPISEKQLAEIMTLVKNSGADQTRFCALFNVQGLSQIPKLRFSEAKAQLLRKIKAKEAKAKAASDFPGDRPL